MLRGVPYKRPSKRSPAHAHQNVVPIDKLPRHVAGLPEAQLIAWFQEATQLTIHQLVTRPALSRCDQGCGREAYRSGSLHALARVGGVRLAWTLRVSRQGERIRPK